MANHGKCNLEVLDAVTNRLARTGFKTASVSLANSPAAEPYRAIRLLHLVLTLFLLCGVALAQGNTQFQYIYDASGQLIKAIDSAGNVITYGYDSAGNIVSITRSSVPANNGLTILNFTPQQGPVGQVVTIQGQGFSTIPSDNSVAFNGTPATVTAATANSLTVAVPSGATTGPITIAVGTSTTTSSTNFTVLQIPVITSINPKSAVQGGSVSNFQVTGINLTGATFGFLPAFTPAEITASGVSVSPDGTSATMSLTLASSAIGSFTVVATNTGGSSSPLPTSSNTLTVLSPNPSADADGDGLTNIYEGAINSDPLNASTTNDGIPDGWALFFGLNPANAGGAGQTAPDGLTYLQAFQQGLNPLIPSLAPPAVVSVSPANGSTNDPTNGVIVIRFNEPLQTPVTLDAAQNAINAGLPSGSSFSSSNSAAAAQILQAFLLRTCCGGTAASSGTVQVLQGGRPVAGTISLSNDALSLVFTPTQGLSSSTTYTIIVQGVKAASGVPMAGAFQSSFTTGIGIDATPGRVVLTSPANGTAGVPTNTAFMVEFSKQVNPASLTPQTFSVIDNVTGQPVQGMLQVDASGFTASFVPQTQYAVGRLFVVELSQILDLTGNPFPFNFFEFTTGFTAQTQVPTVVGVSPANGAIAVPTNAVIVAQFSEPLSVINATAGLQVSQGGIQVAGAMALSNGNTQITFTPVLPLNPGVVYTITATNQITDVAGNALANPSTFTFTTGVLADNTTPAVTAIAPANGEVGFPTNGVIQLQFSKPVNPLTVNMTDFQVFPQDTFNLIPGTIVVTPDGLTATFTPASPLEPSTTYLIEATSGITDLEGNQLQFLFSSFTTGQLAAISPNVVQVSPPNGASGVPVNPVVVVVVSAPVSPSSVSNSAITISAGGTLVSGTVNLSGDQTTLTFVPTSLLAAGTRYTVTVSGFTDQAGNKVVPFSSSFTTGTSGVANTSQPTVTAVSPANGAAGVSTNSAIVLTFNEAVDAVTVNANTVSITANQFAGQLAGSYTLDATGKIVTFTPLSPLPGNSVINVAVNGVLDLSGNSNVSFQSSFTTGAGVDATAPTVVMVTPTNGATGIGLTTVVLTFSKSLNPGTITNSTVGLLANGSNLFPAISVSADNRVVTLNVNTLPASSTVTVVATSGIMDLSGNSLVNFESSFTTAAFDTTNPFVVSQRPGNGATGVPLNSSVVLYLSEPMNAATVQGAVQVSQNGVLVSGTTQVSENGEVAVFTPSQPFPNNALVQVFVNQTAEDTDGNSLSAYQGSFTTVLDPNTTAPSVVSISPTCCANVPTNAVINIGFNEPLNPATVNTTSVNLFLDCCAVIPSTVSLINGGTVVQITPSTPLAPNTEYFVQINTGLQGTNGLTLPFAQDVAFFFTGAGPDTVAPVVLSVSPPNGAVNVGDNAQIEVAFNEPVNPLTANAGTIQLSSGGVTVVADAISFSNNNQNVVLVPHAPLPDNTLMTVTIAGVMDVAGNAAPAQTTTFTTGQGPDVISPAVIEENPFDEAENVPLNAPIMLRTNEPVVPGSVNSNTLFIVDDFEFQQVAGTYSVSTDGRTINFLPSSPLAENHAFFVIFANDGITDLAGNQLSCTVLCNFFFFTGTREDLTGPSVVGVSPANGLTGVPVNTQVLVQFSEPVDALTINQVTLSVGGTPIPVTSTLSNANQTLTLTPVVPLNANTPYTVNVTGVQDLSGNVLPVPVITTFTTGTAADLTLPAVTAVSPADGATGALTNGTIQVTFSKRVDPLTVTTTDFIVAQSATGIPVPGTISFSADGATAIFTPSSPLSPLTNYSVDVSSGILDLEGQSLQFSFFSSFQTGAR